MYCVLCVFAICVRVGVCVCLLFVLGLVFVCVFAICVRVGVCVCVCYLC